MGGIGLYFDVFKTRFVRVWTDVGRFLGTAGFLTGGGECFKVMLGFVLKLCFLLLK